MKRCKNGTLTISKAWIEVEKCHFIGRASLMPSDNIVYVFEILSFISGPTAHELSHVPLAKEV